MSNPPINFLSVETILKLHAIAIEDQRGDPSLRDRGLLESAVGMPKQQFAGEFLHPDIPAMAAAYAFHICGNHPFVDGNKRAGLAAVLAFLVDNGWTFEADEIATETMIVRLASSLVPKDELTAWVRIHAKPSSQST